jgi:hypothetical protein
VHHAWQICIQMSKGVMERCISNVVCNLMWRNDQDEIVGMDLTLPGLLRHDFLCQTSSTSLPNQLPNSVTVPTGTRYQVLCR